MKEAVLATIAKIRNEYASKIRKLNQLLVEREAKIVELYHLVNEKEMQFAEA